MLNQVLDEVAGSWRFRWPAFAAATVLAIVGWLAVFAMHDMFEARASVFVDTRTPLKPALQGLTVEQDVDAQLNFVRQSLLAGPSVEKLAVEGGAMPVWPLDPRRQEQLLTEMRQRIDIKVRSASGREEDRNAGSIYTIVYQDRDRERGLKVVKILLDKLVNETLGGKLEGSENAQQFLETQLHDYEQRLRTAEDRLAEFKSRHIGLMPTQQGGYFAELQAESQAVGNVKTKLAEAQSRRTALVKQLHGDAAVAASAPGSSATGAGGGNDTLSRIDAAQAHLDELLLRFTDQHPDVIAARQTLADLKARREREVEGLRQGDAAAAASSRASTNPVYQSVQLALNNVDVEIADLQTELAQHESKVSELRHYLDSAPQVEAEFAQLNRDYDVNKAEYTALLSNLQKARLGERADTAGSIRFEVVQPPTADLGPAWPRRKLFLLEVLAGAIAAGAALAYGLNYLHPVVSSAEAVTRSFRVPVLGQVSNAFPEHERRIFRLAVVRISLACGCLVVAFGVAAVLSQAGYRLSLTALKHLVSG